VQSRRKGHAAGRRFSVPCMRGFEDIFLFFFFLDQLIDFKNLKINGLDLFEILSS